MKDLEKLMILLYNEKIQYVGGTNPCMYTFDRAESNCSVFDNLTSFNIFADMFDGRTYETIRGGPMNVCDRLASLAGIKRREGL